jgi:DNA repair protein RadC
MTGEELDRLYSKLPEVDLVYKPKIKPSQLPIVNSSYEAYELLKFNWNDGKIDLQEEFKVLFLNRANRVVGIYHVSTGGITGTVADPRLIYTAALKTNCVSIILAHNHPSGNLKPSRADEELTQKIKSAGNFLDIKLLDHIIITSENFYSFADEGNLNS